LYFDGINNTDDDENLAPTKPTGATLAIWTKPQDAITKDFRTTTVRVWRKETSFGRNATITRTEGSSTFYYSTWVSKNKNELQKDKYYPVIRFPTNYWGYYDENTEDWKLEPQSITFLNTPVTRG
jgi:hypothetical protein